MSTSTDLYNTSLQHVCKSIALSNIRKYNDMISHGRKQQISVIFPDRYKNRPRERKEERGQGGKNDFLTVSPRRWKSGRLKPPASLGR